MKSIPSALRPLEREYQRLRQSLAQIGYISQGSVLDRSTLKPSRSGYQWTRKVAGKTITVSLSAEQFQSMKRAVENERKLWKTIYKMEKVSRQILFGIMPDTRRRKRLGAHECGDYPNRRHVGRRAGVSSPRRDEDAEIALLHSPPPPSYATSP